MNIQAATCSAFALFSLLAPPAMAAQIVNFDFDAGTGNFVNPSNIAANPGITNVSTWSDRDGALILPSMTSPGGLVGNPNTGRAIAATSFGPGSLVGNEFRFSFGVVGTLSLTDFSFWQQGSNGTNGAGPSSWSLFINNQQVATGATTLGMPGGAVSGGLALTGLTGTVNLRIFASGAANDATATWRVDNFILNGSVVPPAAGGTKQVPLPLGALAALALCLAYAGTDRLSGQRAG